MPNQDNQDITKLKQELHKKDIQIRELKSLTSKDPLTGLFNRRGFEEETNRFLKGILFAKNNPTLRKYFFAESVTISILFFDIDDFKKLNDTYSHKVGDQVLKQIAGFMSKKVRSIDIVGRIGGEEIVVALIGSDEKDAFQKAEEIRKAIKSRVKVPGSDEHVTVSVGVSTLDKKTSDLQELIKNADEAMYVAKKERGKNCTVKFSELKKKKK